MFIIAFYNSIDIDAFRFASASASAFSCSIIVIKLSIRSMLKNYQNKLLQNKYTSIPLGPYTAISILLSGITKKQMEGRSDGERLRVGRSKVASIV